MSDYIFYLFPRVGNDLIAQTYDASVWIDFWAQLILVIANVTLAAMFIWQTQKKNRHTPYLTTGLIMGSIANLIAFLDSSIIGISDVIIKNEYLFVTQNIFFLLTFIFFYFHLEYLAKERIPSWRLILVFTLFGASVGGLMAHIVKTELLDFYLKVFSDTPLVNDTIKDTIIANYYFMFDQIIDSAYYSLGTFVFGVGAVRYWKIYDRVKEDINKIFFGTMLVMSIGMFLMFVFKTDKNVFQGNLFKVSTIAYTVVLGLIAISLLAYATVYVLNPDYLYRLPIDIHALMIIDSAGLPVYTQRFKAVSEIDFPEALITGFLTAISTFITNVTSPDEKLQSIQATNFMVYLERQGEYMFAFVTERMTYFFKYSAKLFTKLIIETHEIQGNAIFENDELMKKLIRKAFPYLEFLTKE